VHNASGVWSLDLAGRLPQIGVRNLGETYDLASNRQSIEALIRFCVDQQVMPQAVEIEDLFPSRILNFA
jgi:hypothetical protein